MPPDVHWGDPEFMIIAIARKYLITHEKWEGAQFECPTRRTEGGWSVLVRESSEDPRIHFDDFVR